MALKEVSIWIGAVTDKVVNVTVGGTPYSADSVNALIASHGKPTGPFWLATNPNGQTDLAFEIDDTIEYQIGNFKQTSNNANYSLPTEDYYGGQPKTRCPQC